MRVLFSRGLIAISKPRCGSTSVRRVLDKLVDPTMGDIVVDVAGQRPPYHPHHTAPFLKKLLIDDGHDISGMKTFIITRNPLDMLWSYFNFFAPDEFGLYNYNQDWSAGSPVTFETWVMTGRVGMNGGALKLAPDWIRTSDLTPLNLEAHIETRDGRTEVDKIFRLEEIDSFILWLSEQTGQTLPMRHVNKSERGALPKFGDEVLARVKLMFPQESLLYAL